MIIPYICSTVLRFAGSLGPPLFLRGVYPMKRFHEVKVRRGTVRTRSGECRRYSGSNYRFDVKSSNRLQ